MAVVVDISVFDDHSEVAGAQLPFLHLSQSIVNWFSKYFFLLKADDFISAFLVGVFFFGAQNFLAKKRTKQGPSVVYYFFALKNL